MYTAKRTRPITHNPCQKSRKKLKVTTRKRTAHREALVKEVFSLKKNPKELKADGK